MDKRPSLAGRALLALALTVGFYALAFGIAGLLVWLVYAQVAYAHRISIKLSILALIGAASILWAVIPRPEPFVPPGPRLTRAEQPRLFAALEEVAQKTGQAMPRDVYLVNDINAFVAQRGGILGLGGHRLMGLGLPLMQVLSESEFKAVLAHEFGHFHGGDTALGPLIYQTRGAIGRTVTNLADAGSMLHLPFLWYGKLFLRMTHAISRAQEYAADALAASTIGSRALIGGLRKLPGSAAALQPYMQQELIPLLSAGVRPPMAQGFAQFLRAESIAQALDRLTADQLASDAQDPYDTHPPLSERIASVSALPTGPDPGDEPAAIELLDNLDEVERTLLGSMMREAHRAQALSSVRWEEVGERIIIPDWRTTVEQGRAVLAGLTPATLPTDPDTLAAMARRALGDRLKPDAARDALAGWTTRLLATATALALVERGWTAASLPGVPIHCVRGERTIPLLKQVEERVGGQLDPADWLATVTELEIADVDLGTVGQPAHGST